MGIDGVQTTDSMNIFQAVDESMTEWGTPFPDTPKSSNFQTFQSLEGDGLFFSDKCSGYLTQIWLNLRRKPSRMWVDFEWSLEPL
jgi:predicted small integral membrane protein